MQPMLPKKPFGWVGPWASAYARETYEGVASVAIGCKGMPTRGPHRAIPIAQHPNGLPEAPSRPRPSRSPSPSGLAPYRRRARRTPSPQPPTPSHL